MNVPTREYAVVTSHGTLTVEEAGRGDLAVLLIHGNSFCRGVFRHQLRSGLTRDFRLIAFDLPGHGDSSDAPDPDRTYTLPGLTDAVVELLKRLDVTEMVVVGWSLGGHIGIEMTSRPSGMRGLLITGTPPVRPDDIARGFTRAPGAGLAGRERLSEAECEAFARAIFGASIDPFLVRAVARADGRFRRRLFEAARAGAGVDQRAAVETSPIPIAVVNGGSDSIVNLDYIDSLAYGDLWDGRCHRLAGAGHAPAWESPHLFNPILERFLHDVARHRPVAEASARSRGAL